MRLRQARIAAANAARNEGFMAPPSIGGCRAPEFEKLISPQAANDTGRFATPPLKRSAVDP